MSNEFVFEWHKPFSDVEDVQDDESSGLPYTERTYGKVPKTPMSEHFDNRRHGGHYCSDTITCIKV